MIGAGLAILALLGLGLWTGNVRRRDALLLVVAVPSVILLLVLFQVIDWKAYQQIFNLKQTYYTLTATIDKETVRELVVLKGSNPASFVWGSGIAPILSDTYSSGLYLGQTIASDDAFYLQVLSQYGIVCVAMYIGLMVIGLKGAIGSFYRNDPEYVRKYEYVPFGLIGLIVLGMINIFHGASLIKPHVSMIFYVSIGCMSVILSRRGSEDAEREALDAGRTGVRARLLRVDP
jgi:FtsH-binding integral membrane protein